MAQPPSAVLSNAKPTSTRKRHHATTAGRLFIRIIIVILLFRLLRLGFVLACRLGLRLRRRLVIVSIFVLRLGRRILSSLRLGLAALGRFLGGRGLVVVVKFLVLARCLEFVERLL